MVAARCAHGASLPPLFLAFGRWLAALLILLPFVGRSLLAHRREIIAGLPALIPLSILGMGVAVAPQYIGAQSTGATNIALIFSCSPLMVAAIDAVLERRAIPPQRMLGLLCALAGVLAVVARGRPEVLLTLGFSRGDLWILLAACGWAIYTVLLKRLSLPVLPASTRLAALMAGGVIALAPFALLEAASGHPPHLDDPHLPITVLFLALVPSLGAYFVYGRLVAVAGSATASLSMYLVPIFAAAISWLLLGETLEDFHMLGFTLIIAGMSLAAERRLAVVVTPPSFTAGRLSSP
jgi:drug/metabolite transporter (DMT)-like permease